MLWGVALSLVKYGSDMGISHRYWNPSAYLSMDQIFDPLVTATQQQKELLLLVTALFVVIGLFLTVGRLRDAALPLAMAVLFFVPFVNRIFFLLLCLTPARQNSRAVPDSTGADTLIGRLVPYEPWKAVLLGPTLPALLGAVLFKISTEIFAVYSVGLFFGAPFVQGMMVGWIVNYHGKRSSAKTTGYVLLSLLITAGSLIALRWEGMVCIVMAAPLAIPIAAFGGLVGSTLASPLPGPRNANAMLMSLVLVPALLATEKPRMQNPDGFAVTTEIEIQASPQVVWNNVIGFSRIPPPHEWYFRTGIAYPLDATIAGSGPSAVRHCNFTTGSFVEPITTWDEPRLLRFNVEVQPPAMRELSYGPDDIVTPHVVGNYIRSQRGQFRLEPLPDGSTRLIGTTWYTLRIWPSSYWSLWSDQIIHRIHLRVLKHIKDLSEQGR